jgi:hypothetical protein
MHPTLVADLTHRLAVLPEWCAAVLDDGAVGFLEWLAGDAATGTAAQRHQLALQVRNSRVPPELEARCQAEYVRAWARGGA